MQQSDFEKQVQQKMEELKLSPADAVWEKVAAGLPAEKKPRRWVFFMLLVAGLLGGAVLLWDKFGGEDKQVVTNDTAVKENILQNNIVEDSKKEKPLTAEIITAQNNNNGIKIKSGNSSSDKTTVVVEVKNKPKSGVLVNNTLAINSIIANVKTVNIKAALKVKTKVPVAVEDEQELIVVPKEKDLITENAKTVVKVGAPVAVEDEQELIVVPKEKGLITENAKTVVKVGAPVAVNDDVIEWAKKTATDLSSISNNDAVVSKDTTIATVAGINQKKKNSLKFKYGVRVAAGSGALKKGLLTSTALFSADARLFNNSAGVPPSIAQAISKPNNPATGIVFNIGFYAQKNINARWKFSTGLNYAYQSNIIKVGKRVDTAATFRFDVSKSLSADNYYKIGDDIKYRNKFHLIEVPLLFQWKLSKKSPVYFEGGPTVGYLISSNALVYNSNSGAYFTDAAVFNKLLLSFTAGAGINLAQNKKLPFSIGYQFGYSTSSATKKVFGKQHFVSSILYIKIPFKK
jgi:hypothetical protein